MRLDVVLERHRRQACRVAACPRGHPGFHRRRAAPPGRLQSEDRNKFAERWIHECARSRGPAKWWHLRGSRGPAAQEASELEAHLKEEAAQRAHDERVGLAAVAARFPAWSVAGLWQNNTSSAKVVSAAIRVHVGHYAIELCLRSVVCFHF